jgi:hypothetical protein
MRNKRDKVIFSPQLAQYLLHCGFTIIDLKRKKGTANETVFVFKYQEGLEEQIATWLEDEAY